MKARRTSIGSGIFCVCETVEKEVTFLAVPSLRFHPGGRNVAVVGDSRQMICRHFERHLEPPVFMLLSSHLDAVDFVSFLLQPALEWRYLCSAEILLRFLLELWFIPFGVRFTYFRVRFCGPLSMTSFCERFPGLLQDHTLIALELFIDYFFALKSS